MDPTLLAVVVSAIFSAIVAFAVLGFDKWFIEPREWLKRYQTRVWEQRIELHCWLLSILSACREKAKRQEENRVKPTPHLLESADIWKLEKIFEKRAYLLSDALRSKWYELQKQDKFFGMMRVRYREEEININTPQGESYLVS